MKSFLLGLLDWIYKKKCYCCASSKECVCLCSQCYQSIQTNSPFPDRIILNTDVYVAGCYDKNLQKIIRGIKYHRKKELAYYMSKLMYEYFETLGIDKKFQVIPVPLHDKRKKQRGYNHMALVAKEFCAITGFIYNDEAILRVKNTKPQYKLSRSQRMENLKDAFIIDKSKLTENPILLIDDICTSGATFESIIIELNKHGVSDITCFATTSPS